MIETNRPRRWYRHADVVLILGVLLAIGVVNFSRISPDQRREIELQARLEHVLAVVSTFSEVQQPQRA